MYKGWPEIHQFNSLCHGKILLQCPSLFIIAIAKMRLAELYYLIVPIVEHKDKIALTHANKIKIIS